MKSFSTRILSLLLVLTMIFSIMPSALAVDEVTEDQIHTEDCIHEDTIIETDETEPPVMEDTPSETVPEEPIIELPVEPAVSESEVTETVTPEPTVTETPVSPATSGYILGSTVYWELSNGQLLISGFGNCPTFTSAADQPWAHLRNDITAVWFNTMDDLCISDLAYWFDGCTNLTSAEIPYTTPVIGTRAFADCPNLSYLQIYHQETAPTIASGAFYLSSDSGVTLQILTISGYPNVVLPFHQYPWALSNRSFLYFGDVYGLSTLEYHADTIGYCPHCGENSLQGTYVEESHPHEEYNQCRSCGYTDYLGSYVTKNHGDGSWGSWSCPECGSHSYQCTISISATCTDNGLESYSCVCGDSYTKTIYAPGHDYYWSYSSYSDMEHYYFEECYNCDLAWGNYESHSFYYGSWSNYDSAQHRRNVYCYLCDYNVYEYSDHSFSYGKWTNYSATQHRRTVKCSVCGYSSYEYANHSLKTGSWTTHSDSQHKRTNSCSCGYSSTEYADHSFTYSAWTTTDTQHSRIKSCSCGYSSTESGEHADANADGSCDTCGYVTARFSVTVPTSMTMAVSKRGEVYAAESAAIVNHSTGAVKVSSVSVTTANGWTLVPYHHNMADAKMDAKLIGFSINGAQSMSTGTSENLSISGWNIGKGDSLSLNYDAVVSGSRTPINEQVLTVVFVLNWAV